MIWCFNQGPDFGYTNDPSGATYKISVTISFRKNGYPCKGIYNDRSSSQGGARHDIILPGHQRTNVITSGKLSQPSYLTEIQIRLVSWYLRLRMSKKKRCNTNSMKWHCKILEKWTMGAGSWNNSSSLHQGGDEEVADGLNKNSLRFTKRWVPTIMRTRR